MEAVRRGIERVGETGQFPADTARPDFVLDISRYAGWTEQLIYAGAEGVQRFLDDWTGVWDHWEVEIQELHDLADHRARDGLGHRRTRQHHSRAHSCSRRGLA